MLFNNIVTLCKCGLSNLCGVLLTKATKDPSHSYSYYTEYEPIKEEDNDDLKDDCYCGMCNCFRETSYFVFRQLTIKEKKN